MTVSRVSVYFENYYSWYVNSNRKTFVIDNYSEDDKDLNTSYPVEFFSTRIDDLPISGKEGDPESKEYTFHLSLGKSPRHGTDEQPR